MKFSFIFPELLDIFSLVDGLIFIVLGLLLIVYVIIWMGMRIVKILTFKPVKGMVVGYARYADMNDCYGIASEYVVNDLTYSVNSINKTSDMKSRYPIGSAVKLKYNPKNPSDAIYTDDDGYILVMIIGIALLVIGFTAIIS